MVTRRRIFSILAGCAAVPAVAAPAQSWQGRAMGADAQIMLRNRRKHQPMPCSGKWNMSSRRSNRCFSLHVDSELTRLNATGFCVIPRGR